MRAGQGLIVNSISMKEGDPEVPRTRPGSCARLRGRGRGDGVRREGSGGHAGPQGRDLHARLRPSSRSQDRLPARGYRVRPEHLRCRDGHRGARPITASTSSRRPATITSTACRTPTSRAASPTCPSRSAATSAVREAMHAVFLYHAIAGRQWTWASSMPGSSPLYADHRSRTARGCARTWSSTAVPARRRPPPSSCSSCRPALQGQGRGWRPRRAPISPGARRLSPSALEHALVNGITEFINAGCRGGARLTVARPLHVIEGPLMGGMNRGRRPVRRGQDVPAASRQVGPRDEAGRRLPRCPSWPKEKRRNAEDGGPARQSSAAGKILMATVKGDVHDIGKNIVGVVLACNNYEVIDLGVMVPAQEDPRHGARAREGRHHRAVGADHALARRDWRIVAAEMEREGFDMPAADRRRHHEPGPHRGQDPPELQGRGQAVYVNDASRAVGVVSVAALVGDRRTPPYAGHRAGGVPQGRGRACAAPSSTRSACRWRRRAPTRLKLDWAGYDAAEAHCSPGRAMYPHRTTSRSSCGYDRLDAVLPDLGHEGPLPGDPGGSTRRAPPRVQLYEDAQAHAEARIVEERWFNPKAIIGFWPANAVGRRYPAVHGRVAAPAELATFFTACASNYQKRDGRPNLSRCRTYMAPAESGLPDYRRRRSW